MDGTFLDELTRYGPEARRDNAFSFTEAEAYCKRLARGHYENFPLVSWLLPRHLHQHFYNIYAYCRWADDLGDEVGDRQRSLELLDWWRQELTACFAGSAWHPVFVAMTRTIREFQIPMGPFRDLISAFEQDQQVTEYQSFDGLRDYCRRSADPVGRLVLYLCRSFNEENAAWSDSICTGLQLANFWQDVARDKDIDRVYLPKDDCQRFGYSQADLENRVTNEAFLQLMEFQVERARHFLRAGLPLIPKLPGRLQVDIELFACGGLRVLERIEQIGYRVWDTRPKVTKWDACRLLAGCVVCKMGRRFGAFRNRYQGQPDFQRVIPSHDDPSAGIH